MTFRRDPVKFDWYTEGAVPNNQRQFVDEQFTPIAQQITHNEDELGRRYFREILVYARQIFEEGAVLANANPENATRKLPDLRKRMEQCLLNRQKQKSNKSTILALISAVVLFGIGYYIGSKYGLTLERNLVYVAATSILADAFLMRATVVAETMVEYEKKKYLLDYPFLRIILLAMAVELFAILLWKGGLQLKVGTIDLQKLDEDPYVAIVIGAAGGFLGSDLVKVLMSALRQSVGRVSSSQSSGRGGHAQARRSPVGQSEGAPLGSNRQQR